MTTILGIETTCDETACAVVREGRDVLSSIVASQVDVHSAYGGVFPEIASRQHCELVFPVIENALKEAGIPLSHIDGIAVAKGPGLIGSLLIGMNAAKALAYSWSKPLIGINHVEAHMYAAMMAEEAPQLPALGLVLSGGHTFIAAIDTIGSYRILATTVDDAVGEAFDKVAKLLDLPYPGGPQIEKIAQGYDPSKYSFKAGFVKENPINFSLSGIKTAVANAVQKIPEEARILERPFIAASFQETVFEDIAKKLALLADQTGLRTIYCGGGVCCNQRLHAILERKLPQAVFYWAPKALCLDNAVMIAGLGCYKLREKPYGDSFLLEPQTRMPLSTTENSPIISTSKKVF